MGFIPDWLVKFTGFGGAGERFPGVQTSLSGGSPVMGPVGPDIALRLSAIWACTRIISETVAGMPVVFYKINSDGTKTIDREFRLSRILNYSPNQWQTGVEYANTCVFNESMHGNSYSLIQRNSKDDIVALVPLMASQMTVELTNDGKKVFVYNQGGSKTTYSSRDIWHTMLLPSNGIVGLSPLQYASRAINIGNAAEDRVGRQARNNFKPGGVLTIDKVLKPEQREQIRNQFKDLSEGENDPIKVLEAGLTYHQISLSPKDAQLLETRQYTVEDICRFWGVPSILVNDNRESSSWGAGIRQLVEGFYKLTIRPYLERRESSIKKYLLKNTQRVKYDVKFDFSSLLRGDDQVRIENMARCVSGGLKTINEARNALDGSLPVEGGDKIYLQQQMTPIEELKNDSL